MTRLEYSIVFVQYSDSKTITSVSEFASAYHFTVPTQFLHMSVYIHWMCERGSLPSKMSGVHMLIDLVIY